MRRALGWLLPVPGAGGALTSTSSPYSWLRSVLSASTGSTSTISSQTHPSAPFRDAALTATGGGFPNPTRSFATQAPSPGTGTSTPHPSSGDLPRHCNPSSSSHDSSPAGLRTEDGAAPTPRADDCLSAGGLYGDGRGGPPQGAAANPPDPGIWTPPPSAEYDPALLLTRRPTTATAAADAGSEAFSAAWYDSPSTSLSSCLVPPLPLPLPVEACTAAEPSSALLAVVQHAANSYEFVHTTSGLPWVVCIPLTTLALRLALLPLSLRQARIIRTNLALYREALALTDQQEREQREKDQQEWERREEQQGRVQQPEAFSGGGGGGSGGGGSSELPSPASTSTAAAATTATASAATGSPPAHVPDASDPDSLHARLLRSQALLSNYHLLRRKCEAPHPAWLAMNPLVQIPVFVAASSTLGIMCRAHWPGMSTEGALWFPDLTLPALVMETGEAPLGSAGLALPLLVYGMTMTSLRLGFGASGVAAAAAAAPPPPGSGPSTLAAGLHGTALGAFLRSLPPLLYTLTTLNLYFKVQMPHGVLVHWLGSAGFTLGLQLALRNPTVRALLRLKPPGASGGSPSSLAASASSETTAGPEALRRAAVPSELVARVAETSDPNVLVVMGAQLSARQHYPAALHCLSRAVLLNPAHVRAHYSMGQVYSLTGCWPDAELSYRAAAGLSQPGPDRGQALYCVATALHTQGKLAEATEAYNEADTHWPGQTVVLYGKCNALTAAGRRDEALVALAEAEARDEGSAGRPFRQALARLRARLTEEGGGEGGEGGGRAGGAAADRAEGAGARG